MRAANSLTLSGRPACRHVKTTGDIKDFVVTEEAGIAKGVRRIIAVTGTEAREASHLANDAEDELKHITTLKGKEREKAAKSYLTVSLARNPEKSSSL